MNRAEIAALRLHNQFLAGQSTLTPVEIVRWQGAMQSQEFGPAKWSIGQRIAGALDTDTQRALDAGEILRTHALRPTWHFVSAQDIRWVLELTAPRVHQLNAAMYRTLELDDALLGRCHDLIAAALAGNRHLTRKELGAALAEAGIDAANGLRLGYIMMHAELDGLVCSGALRGKQQTYALISERVPQSKSLPRDEAVVELVRRYFTSHGPATANDFARWSGLTVADAKRGIEALGSALVSVSYKGRDLWFRPPEGPIATGSSPAAHLVQGYDEYVIGYGDFREIFNPRWERMLSLTNPFLHAVLIDGQVVASWKRAIGKSDLLIEVNPHRDLSPVEREAIRAAADAHGGFLGMTASLAFRST
jgi:hypothetical protein